MYAPREQFKSKGIICICEITGPPSYNTEHRGRRTGRDEQSGHRISSFGEASTSGSRVFQPIATSQGRGRRGRGSKVRNTQTTHDYSPVPPIRDTYIEKLPVPLQCYIFHTVDVQPYGYCRFRVIAALIGYGEES